MTEPTTKVVIGLTNGHHHGPKSGKSCRMATDSLTNGHHMTNGHHTNGHHIGNGDCDIDCDDDTTGASSGRFLRGKTALVTGSTSGIGLGIARKLAKRGCSVILTGFGDDNLIATIKQELSSYGVEVHYIAADLTKSEQLEEMCRQILNMYPKGVDILVNNAGFQHVSPVDDFPTAKWDAMIALMLTAPFHLIRLLLPHMKEKHWGRIINISSVHGLKASPNKSAYIAAKHGLVGLTKTVALESARDGVTCMAICPGYVETELFQAQVRALAEKEKASYDVSKVKFLSNVHASGEAVAVDQVAETAVFLCTGAASQMTGSCLVLDGGWAAK